MDFNSYSERISHFLIGKRQRDGLTQKELAKKICVSETTISRLEAKSKESIKLQELVDIAKLAQLSLSEFFYYLEDTPKNPKQISKYWYQDFLETLLLARARERATFINLFNSKKDSITNVLSSLNAILKSSEPNNLSTIAEISQILEKQKGKNV